MGRDLEANQDGKDSFWLDNKIKNKNPKDFIKEITDMIKDRF